MSAGAGAFPPEREQSFVGGNLLSLICPESGVTPLTDPGTDLEDELPMPATSPVTVDHGAAPRSSQADVDSDLVRIFEDAGALPAMVTPLSDPEGGLIGSPAGYAVPVIADASDRIQCYIIDATTGGDLPGWANRHGSCDSAAIDRVDELFSGTFVAPSGARRPGLLPWTSVFSGLVLHSEGSWRVTLCLRVP